MNNQKNLILLRFWERLKTVSQMTLHATSKAITPTGWSGKGKGSVLIEPESNTSFLFHEKGSWETGITFTNTFRWSLHLKETTISLEHFHLGPKHPVFLFDLVPTEDALLSAISSHLCREDSYTAQALFSKHIRLIWSVKGPKKDECLDYCYS